MLVIGSNAIAHWFDDFPREPKDIDIILCEGEVISKYLTEESVEVLKDPGLLKYFPDNNGKMEVLPQNTLTTLKASHLFWDINWSKHMYDLQFLLGKGGEIKKDLFYELYEFWNIYHSFNKRSDLKMSAEDFFNNAIDTGYSHDYLHTLITPIPAYTKVLIGEVEVSEDKFNELKFEDKLDLVKEEVMVMAWERYRNMDYRIAYSKMLKKFIISHAPIWEGLFILTNYHLLRKPIFNFIEFIDYKLNKIV